MKWISKINRSEKGQGLVEYGLILALVSVVAVGAIGGVGDKVSSTFSSVDNELYQGIYTNEEIDAMVNNGYIPIATANELDQLRENKEQTFGEGTEWKSEYASGLDKKYIQVANIDMGSIANFEPFGGLIYNETNSPNVSYFFSGDYDGGGYTINRLTIDHKNKVYSGFFGQVKNATIANMSLINASISGKNYVGGLVGNQYKTNIINCSVEGLIKGDNFIGGLVGVQWDSSRVSNSVFTGDISGVDHIGGLVGIQDQSDIANSYTISQVSGRYSVGGVLGFNRNRSSIKNSGWMNDIDSSLKSIGSGSADSTTDNVQGLSRAEIEPLIKGLRN